MNEKDFILRVAVWLSLPYIEHDQYLTNLVMNWYSYNNIFKKEDMNHE